MATNNNIKQFTAADIEKYHKGLLSAKEKHDLEKAALDDPFLADALEGYAFAGSNVSGDLADLKKRLGTRAGSAKMVQMKGSRNNLSPFMRAAAILIILASAGLLVYQFAFNQKDTGLAEVNSTATVKEEVRASGNDTLRNIPAESRQETDLAGTGKGNKDKPAGTEAAPNGLTGKDAKENAALKDIAAEKTDEAVAVTSDIKSLPAGEIPATGAPAKPVTTTTVPAGAAGKVADKEYAGEETRTRAAVAKKQETDNDLARKRATQQPDDSRGNRDLATNRQADDKYYRNQAMNTFRGRVTDASNVGLPFANVTNTRDNVGTYTDANGNFILTSTDSVLNVQIRSLGYDNSTIQLRNNITGNNVVMQEDRSNLSEVVVSNKKPNAAARSRDNNRQLIEPEPADGWEKYDSYLANNLNTPEDFSQQKTNTGNSVELSFEVDKTGEPVNIRIEKSLCSSCDKEAIRLIKEGPKWKRNASKKGRTTVTIQF